jgi:hypothetical protein
MACRVFGAAGLADKQIGYIVFTDNYCPAVWETRIDSNADYHSEAVQTGCQG